MKKRKIAKLITYTLVACTLLSGCKGKHLEAPELVEPVTTNESYRPVTYGRIGNVNTGVGVVVPTDYCHFFTSSVQLSEIKVSVGEYVEEGQVLALVDTEEAKNNIEALNAELSLKDYVWSIKEDIYEYDLSELTYKHMGYTEKNDTVGAEQIATEIAILKENHSFDELMHQYEVDNINKRIEEEQKVLNDGTLVAKKSGYVTYVKNLSDSDMVPYGENVVIISDYEDCYIKVVKTPVEPRDMGIYSYYYTVLSGEKVDLVYKEYLPEEMIVAQNKGLYPSYRMMLADETKMPEPGTGITIYFHTNFKDNVLIVGNDSIFQDEKGTFVNVKTDEGVETRYIEIGEKDNFYTEVVSGLSEGELVAYSSEAIELEEYEELAVEYTEYMSTYEMESSKVLDTTSKKYYSEYEGTISSVAVADGDTVESGDLICTIETNEGSAMLAEMRNNIDSFKASHTGAMASYDEQIKQLEAEMALAYESANAPVETPTATDSDATEVEEVEPYLYEQLSCQLEKLKLNKQIEEYNYTYQLGIMEENYNEVSANNDGNGYISIYATQSGEISALNLRVGKNISVNDRIYNVKTPSEKVVQITSEEPLMINQKVAFYNGDKNYTGTIIGLGSGSEDFYFTNIDNKIYITNNGQPSLMHTYYVKVDDEAYYDVSKDCSAYALTNNIENAVVLYKGQIFAEEMIETTVYYVWKIRDGELYKEYVQVIPAGNTGGLCVISGISEGDIIAVEKNQEVKE